MIIPFSTPFLALTLATQTIIAPVSGPGFWPIRSVDTMKISRDRANQPAYTEKIPLYVDAVAELGANYIAVGTPYDEEFSAVLEAWVTEARKKNLSVWFRGNFSGWEGWFNYPRLSGPDEHIALMQRLIAAHPDLFRDGDIFTPAPEPENGILRDPYGADRQAYLSFLTGSYDACTEAMKDIGKRVACGYFSMNGDIARNVLTRDVASHLGVVVIDHYVRTVRQLAEDIRYLQAEYGVPVVLGETGVPIPEIHGAMTEKAQAEYMDTELAALTRLQTPIEGLNYWTAFEGTTKLFDDPDSPRPVAAVVRNYFLPLTISGTVSDTAGHPLPDIIIRCPDAGSQTKTGPGGRYSLLIPNRDTEVEFRPSGKYKPLTVPVKRNPENRQILTVSLEPSELNIFGRIFKAILEMIRKNT